VEVKEKPPSPTAISSRFREEKTLLVVHDMPPSMGDFGLYQKMLFTLLEPSAFFVYSATPEGYWLRIPELMDLTVEQRLVAVKCSAETGEGQELGYHGFESFLDCRKKIALTGTDTCWFIASSGIAGLFVSNQIH
jgi:hypothetical protein